ncbi:MAG: Gram-negative bacterial tonB protein [Proteobacteria bacterium]|nr:Gram-negative bacterial tonB protein [Pseudomonadota bacterium]
MPILEKNGIPEYGLLPSTPYYYPVSEVNRKPAVVENINALAPELLELRVTGSAIVSLYINDFGSIDKVEIEESDFNFAARAAIIKEFGKMIFTPASKDNIQVHSKMRIEVMLQNTPAQLVDDPNQPPIPFW